METTKELPGIARLKIHPGKREELNPALPPVLLPEQAPGNNPVGSPGNSAQPEPFNPQSLVTYHLTYPSVEPANSSSRIG